MDKKYLKKCLIIEFIVVSLFCPILHFVFDILNENKFIGAFVPVNESVWEHLKLPIMATLIVFVFSYIKLSKYNNYTLSVIIEIIIQALGIVVIYYTYKLIFKDENMIIDLMSLYVSLSFSIVIKYMIMTKLDRFNVNPFYCNILIIFIFTLFVIFTYVPPKFKIFKDETSGKYGIFKEGE